MRVDDSVLLEAELAVATIDPRAAMVLCHPHPQYGGTMRSIVVSELFKALPGRGVTCLRFNFRGVENSTGTHDHGHGERDDALAAISVLTSEAPDLPLVLAGWSFGADVSASVVDERIAGWFLIAPPLRVLPAREFVVGADPRPKHLAVPEHDAFRPPDSAREATTGWVNTTIEVVAGADHFLVGRTAKVTASLLAFLSVLRFGQ